MTRHRAPRSDRRGRRGLSITGMALVITVLGGASAAPAHVANAGWPPIPSWAQASAKEARSETPGARAARVSRPPVPSRVRSRSATSKSATDAGTAVPPTSQVTADEPPAQSSTADLPSDSSVSVPSTDSPVTGSSTGPVNSPTATSPSAAPPAAAVPATGGGPAGGLFPLVPPDSSLPSGEECAARVQRDPWEPKPENATANSTRPSGAAPYGMSSWFSDEADSSSYRGRVDGDFTGTTDEIIQWASCKWGFPTDINRAQAVAETTWDQAHVGDGGESYGLYQMRRGVWAAFPNSQASTAFNADWAMGLRRACYDGAMWYPELRGNLAACIGVHYSGDPDESTWREYTDAVMEHERTKPWLTWPSAAGSPPRATRAG